MTLSLIPQLEMRNLMWGIEKKNTIILDFTPLFLKDTIFNNKFSADKKVIHCQEEQGLYLLPLNS